MRLLRASIFYLFFPLAAACSFGQNVVPARFVGVGTAAWTNLAPTASTAQATFDFIDANWQSDLVVSNGWTFLAPTAETAQATFDFLDGYAGTNGLLKGSNIVGFSFANGQWSAPDACAAMLERYPFLDVDFRDDAAAAAAASTGLVAGAVFRAVVPAGVYTNHFVFTNSQVEIDSSGGWDAEAQRYRVPADGYYLCGLWPGTIYASGTGTPWQVTGDGDKYMSLSLFDSDTNDVVMAVSGGSSEVANQYSGVDRMFGAIPVFLTNGAAIGLRLTAVPGPARSQLPTYWFVSAIGGGGSSGDYDFYAGYDAGSLSVTNVRQETTADMLALGNVAYNIGSTGRPSTGMVVAVSNSVLVSPSSGYRFYPQVGRKYEVRLSASFASQESSDVGSGGRGGPVALLKGGEAYDADVMYKSPAGGDWIPTANYGTENRGMARNVRELTAFIVGVTTNDYYDPVVCGPYFDGAPSYHGYYLFDSIVFSVKEISDE